ncbi:hypothetical protein IJ541_05710 [bacterium]|nr:hypothetical protein [bacterium]
MKFGKCRGKYNSTETNYNIISPQNDIKNVPSPRWGASRKGKSNCHSELTRKLVELAKRNFLFLLGVSESISKKMLKQVQHDKIFGSLCKVQGDRGMSLRGAQRRSNPLQVLNGIATSDLRPPRNDMQVLQGVAIATGVNKTNLKVRTFTPRSQ